MAEEQKQKQTTEERVKELEGAVAERDTVLSQAKARVAELEQAAAGNAEKMGKLEEGLKQAVFSYKTLVVQANPEVLEEMITGDSIETVEKSLKSVKALISKIRSGIEAEIARGKVPAGAPQRARYTPQTLSPREKIQQGVGRS